MSDAFEMCRSLVFVRVLSARLEPHSPRRLATDNVHQDRQKDEEAEPPNHSVEFTDILRTIANRC